MTTSRILFVSDTTHRLNWGARAASLALQQHLMERFGSVSLLPGEISDNRVAIDTTLPSSFAAPLLTRRYRHRALQMYYRLEKHFGMKEDYVEADPVQSCENVLNNRDQKSIRELYDYVDRADVVIIDGDGDLIFRNPAARLPLFNLAVIELAVRLGKEAHYVNSIFAECPISGPNAEFVEYARATLSKCATVSLRDHASVAHARSIAPELNPQYVPDALFLWCERVNEAAEDLPGNGDLVIPFPHERAEHFGRIRFDRPYICLSGSSHAAFFQEQAVERYTALASAIQSHFKMDVYLTPACHGDRFLLDVAKRTSLPVIPAEVPILMGAAILANAQVYVSGRYHPAILASLGGTPTVFLGADSHKTESLQDLLEYEEPKTFSALPDSAAIEAILNQIELQLTEENGRRDRIRSAAKRRGTEAARLAEVVMGKMRKAAG